MMVCGIFVRRGGKNEFCLEDGETDEQPIVIAFDYCAFSEVCLTFPLTVQKGRGWSILQLHNLL